MCFYQRRQYGFLYSLLKRLPKKTLITNPCLGFDDQPYSFE
ncbi:hypothetical protein [uncultured Gammaproteobacteria bacterium]|nr:hypothetical protein [uncultured Gammaproteobacteria bacterium]